VASDKKGISPEVEYVKGCLPPVGLDVTYSLKKLFSSTLWGGLRDGGKRDQREKKRKKGASGVVREIDISNRAAIPREGKKVREEGINDVILFGNVALIKLSLILKSRE